MALAPCVPGASIEARCRLASLQAHRRVAQTKVVSVPLLDVSVEFEDVEDGLGILGVVFLGDGRRRQEASPLLGQTSEGARDGVEADVDLVDKVGGR